MKDAPPPPLLKNVLLFIAPITKLLTIYNPLPKQNESNARKHLFRVGYDELLLVGTVRALHGLQSGSNIPYLSPGHLIAMRRTVRGMLYPVAIGM
eukprot:1926606-Rhodomonas_salina.2